MNNLAVRNIQSFTSVNPVNEVKEPVCPLTVPDDSVTISNKNSNNRLPKEVMQRKILEAGTSAAGWSIATGVIGTVYYGLRSDKTVAKKFELDAEKDKALIKRIKKEQVLMTLPAAVGTLVFGVGQLATGGITWLINKNRNPENININ